MMIVCMSYRLNRFHAPTPQSAMLLATTDSTSFPVYITFFGLYLAIVANTDHTEVIDLSKAMPAIPL